MSTIPSQTLSERGSRRSPSPAGLRQLLGTERSRELDEALGFRISELLPEIRSILFRRRVPVDCWSDVLQTCFVAWFERRASVENAAGWFLVVLRNQAMRQVARKHPGLRSASGERPEPRAVHGRLNGAEARLFLRDASRSLRPVARELLRLRYLEGLGVAEAAERLGLSVLNAKKILARSLTSMRRTLEIAAPSRRPRCDEGETLAAEPRAPLGGG